MASRQVSGRRGRGRGSSRRPGVGRDPASLQSPERTLTIQGNWGDVAREAIGKLEDSDRVSLLVFGSTERELKASWGWVSRWADATISRSTQVMLKYSLRGQKRTRRDGDDSDEEYRQRRQRKVKAESPEHATSRSCGNCGKAGHQARDCIRVGRSGWTDGACPKCNRSAHHFYDNCPDRRKHEDLDYLFWYRQNKGPIKSLINIGKLLRAALTQGRDPKYKLDGELAPPYSPKFARQIQRDDGWKNWNYQHQDHPEREAANRKYEPQFYGLTLDQLARSLDYRGWLPADEFIDLANDGPTPTLPQHQLRSHWDPVPSASRFRSQRLRAMTAERERQEAANVECKNCFRKGHKISKCIEGCGACGDPMHQRPSCSKAGDVCVCEEFPGHIREACSRVCTYCPYMNGNAPPHTCIDCMAICHYCLDKNHSMRHCPGFMGKDGKRDSPEYCPHCPVEMHLATFCVENICPVFGCEDPYHCEEHCSECGFEVGSDAVFRYWGLSTHECQWLKSWGPTAENPTGRRVFLICKKNMNHNMKAENLQALRQEATTIKINFPNADDCWIECGACKAQEESGMKLEEL
ncbi:hypothetical protein F5Y13DRAFT_199353 [Hypoxylon sp. FL1857]|nr:hypothetical protein F5Y13DRAFT_199353 [Hypoxylon sp. FL1857]